MTLLLVLVVVLPVLAGLVLASLLVGVRTRVTTSDLEVGRVARLALFEHLDRQAESPFLQELSHDPDYFAPVLRSITGRSLRDAWRLVLAGKPPRALGWCSLLWAFGAPLYVSLYITRRTATPMCMKSLAGLMSRVIRHSA